MLDEKPSQIESDVKPESNPLEVEELDANSLEEVSGGLADADPVGTEPVKDPGNGCINGSC